MNHHGSRQGFGTQGPGAQRSASTAPASAIAWATAGVSRGFGSPPGGTPTGASAQPSTARTTSLAAAAKGTATASPVSNLRVGTPNGALTLSIPIYTSPGRPGGLAPSLALTYNSSLGNGSFGLGWQLNSESITRKTAPELPRYVDEESSDEFMLAGGNDLVPSDATPTIVPRGDGWVVQRYYPRTQQNDEAMRVERWESRVDPSDVHWRTISVGNVTSVFGPDDRSRICEQPSDHNGHQKRIFSWLIAEQYDPQGNVVHFRYKSEDAAGVPAQGGGTVQFTLAGHQYQHTQRYLKSIVYGNRVPNRRLEDWTLAEDCIPADGWMFEVIFDYGEHSMSSPTTVEQTPWSVRKDPYSSGEAGFEIRTLRLCRRVLVFHHLPEELAGARDTLVASTRFEYDNSRPDLVSLLSSVTPYGHKPGLRDESLPPERFSYHGAPDLSGCLRRRAEAPLLFGPQGERSQWLDLDEEGIPGLLTKSNSGWSYQPNKSAAVRPPQCQLSPPRNVDLIPGSGADGWVYLNELDELGTHLSALSLSDQGFYMRTEDGGWMNFVPFPSLSNHSSISRHVLTADLTRNGFPDTIVFGGTDMLSVWYPNLGREGSGTPRRIYTDGGVRLDPPFDDPESIVTMSDMTADGLPDIVAIQNNRITYWPNRGHGRFGRPVEMQNAPRVVDFSPQRLKLVDVTCSGNSDLIYFLPGGGADVYYNCTGNGWSDAHHIDVLPAIDDVAMSTVECLDLLGQGTPCICWRTPDDTANPKLHYVDLMAGERPGLMNAHRNGSGMERTFAYCSSTTFYLEDEARGSPWPHRLPFPSLCLEKVLIVDRIAHTAHMLRYAYHDGYYDRRDKEFRGFGLIEEWQAEASWEQASMLTHEVEKCQPTVYRKTWYHLGQASDPTFVPPGQILGPSALPPTATMDACRALKGSVLRAEVHDPVATATDKNTLLTVEEHNYIVRLRPETTLQPKRQGFLIHARESLSTVVDRQDIEHARVQHNVNLKVNNYGQTTKSAVITYGCKKSTLSDAKDREKQEETTIIYSEFEYTNSLDETAAEGFRPPAPCETRSYRILSAKNHTKLCRYDDLVANDYAFFTDTQEVSRDSTAPVQGRTKVLSGRARTIYRSSNLSPLLFGQLEMYSVVDREYQLALTLDDLKSLAHILPATGSEEAHKLMRQRGGYRNILGDEQWWIPSTQSRFGTGDEVEELHAARLAFYLPTLSVDAFESQSHTEYDPYHLLVTKTTDDLGNTTQFTNDYVALAPTTTIDPNGNLQRVALDAFRRTVGISTEGKAGGVHEGDSLEGFLPQLTAAQLETFIETPPTDVNGDTAFLHQTGQRIIYGTGRYYQTSDPRREEPGAPDFKATITRHRSGPGDPDPDSKIKVEIEYFDGSGTPIQVAALESPGKWRFSGWQLQGVDGVGRKEWQPFYSTSHCFQYQPLSMTADHDLTTTSMYDAAGRAVAVLHADHSWTKNRHTPWKTEAFDSGDTVHIDDPRLDPDVGQHFQRLQEPDSYMPSWYARRSQNTDQWERDAARKSMAYSNTPSITHADSLGRTIVAEADNGPAGKQLTRHEYDHLGNEVRVINALGTTIRKVQFDLAGRGVYEASVDSGERWGLFDCLSRPLILQDGKKTRKSFVYDSLQRNTEEWLHVLQDGTNSEDFLVTQMIYGESHPEAEKYNLRGRLYQQYDQSGRTEFTVYDFRGNSTHVRTQFAEDFKLTLDWRHLPRLEPICYETKAQFDALGNAYSSIAADGSETRRTYTCGGHLQSLSLNYVHPEVAATASITNIEYTPWGVQEKVTYGNGVSVRTTFCRETLMVQRRTVQKRRTPGTASSSRTLRDVAYTYDCTGQVTHVHDHARQDTFFRNCRIEPSQDYEYDAIGQLVRARGREQVSGDQLRAPTAALSSSSGGGIPVNGSQLCEYVESYQYDAAGNILELRHEPAHDTSLSGWTRTYEYASRSSCIEPSEAHRGDRLSSTTVRGSVEEYTYDEVGCMISIPGYSSLDWDFNHRLRASAKQRMQSGGARETTWYVYNASGVRVRKVTERAAAAGTTPTKLKETRQLPGCKVYRTFAGNGTTVHQETQTTLVLESWTPGTAAASSAVALVESLSASQTTLVRYQVDENLELSYEGEVVSYEEFSPFGVTTLDGVRTEATAPRQYRFARYERDEETGLFHCGERYYAPWLGRWTSPDPIGVRGGLNLYTYAGNDPVNLEDAGGTAPKGKGETLGKRDIEQRDSEGYTRSQPQTINTAKFEKIQKLHNPGHGKQNNYTHYPVQGDANSADYIPLGDRKVLAGMSGLMGCTSLILVSPKALYMSHWWEDKNFNEDKGSEPVKKLSAEQKKKLRQKEEKRKTVAEHFETQLLGGMDQSYPNHADLKTNAKDFENAVGILVTSYKHPQEKGNKNLINPLSTEKPLPAMSTLVPRYPTQLDAIKAKVEEHVGAVEWVSGFGPYVAPLYKKDLVKACEKGLGTALVEYIPGKKPTTTVYVEKQSLKIEFDKS